MSKILEILIFYIFSCIIVQDGMTALSLAQHYVANDVRIPGFWYSSSFLPGWFFCLIRKNQKPWFLIKKQKKQVFICFFFVFMGFILVINGINKFQAVI